LATYGINIYMQGGTLTSRNEASAFVRQFVADHSKISLNAGTLNADDKKINIVGNNSYGLKLGAVWIQRNNLSASQNLQFESLETSKGNAKVLQIK